MFKLASLAAVAAAALVAAPAGAADLGSTQSVHVSLAGKSAEQVRSDIQAAAVNVCGAHDQVCIGDATQIAFDHLRAVERAQHVSRLQVEAGAAVVRVSLRGKTSTAIDADIHQAARTVCEATSSGVVDYGACVAKAVADAQSQLTQIAQASPITQLASN